MRRPLSSPMAGILTRSRADIFVHRSRSGRVRPDLAGRKDLHDNPIHPTSLSLDVKHLREQERAVSVRCFPYMPGKIDHKDTVIKPSDGSKIDHINSFDGLILDPENKDETFCEQVIRGESMQSTPPDVDILRRAEAVLDLEPLGKACAEELVKASGELQSAADVGSDRLQRNTLKNKQIIARCSRSKLYQNPGSFGYRRLLPYLSDIEKISSDKKCSGSEEIVLPSVPSVKVEKETEEVSMLINAVPLPALKDNIMESEVKPEQQTHDLVSSNVNKIYAKNPLSCVGSIVAGDSIGCLPGDDVESEEKHVTESSISIPEATLCLRSKLYRNPNSFGYRRLQPYLRDLEKDISGGEEILDPHALAVVKKTEELPIMSSVDPCLALKDDGVKLVVGSPTLRITCTTEDNKKSDSGNSAPSLLDAALDDVIAAESPDPFGQNSFQAPMVSDIEMLQLCNSSSYSPSSSVNLSIKELVGNTSDSQSSGLVQKESLPVAPKFPRSAPGSHALTPRKSLLKKHTRGCIGICTCLDCASFRLHAERASEFSRRQVLEADDIVTALTKELACLRQIAEKSASPQVKEVCRNALKVEQVAKSRMRHLICEMNIRCRLPGSRVKFADPMEEIRILDSGKE